MQQSLPSQADYPLQITAASLYHDAEQPRPRISTLLTSQQQSTSDRKPADELADDAAEAEYQQMMDEINNFKV